MFLPCSKRGRVFYLFIFNKLTRLLQEGKFGFNFPQLLSDVCQNHTKWHILHNTCCSVLIHTKEQELVRPVFLPWKILTNEKEVASWVDSCYHQPAMLTHCFEHTVMNSQKKIYWKQVPQTREKRNQEAWSTKCIHVATILLLQSKVKVIENCNTKMYEVTLLPSHEQIKLMNRAFIGTNAVFVLARTDWRRLVNVFWPMLHNTLTCRCCSDINHLKSRAKKS